MLLYSSLSAIQKNTKIMHWAIAKKSESKLMCIVVVHELNVIDLRKLKLHLQ